MAKLILEDVAVEVVQGLERRAKRLGTTIQDEASRLLSKSLRDEEAPHVVAVPANVSQDDRFVRKGGVLVFAGELPADAELDHREVREQRTDSFLKVS